MDPPDAYRRKLIEVALPLEAIDREAVREKSIRHGHPSTLHLWWARRPLAACRAVLFAQLVDDPSAHPDRFPTEEAQEQERQRLFALIERLVPWEATQDKTVLAEAREEIRRSCGDNPPEVLDPFCGGGSIPLEAQRLGLVAHGSDLNPVAVLITKALIELPARFTGQSPVHPGEDGRIDVDASWKDASWKGAQGLAEDVRYYGTWMREEAERRIGHLYPQATLPDGGQATVIAWIWARTVTCPNPACRATMPLVRSFWLGKKKGKETWVRPIIEGRSVRFEIGHGPSGPPVDGTVSRNGATCLICNTPVTLAHIRVEGKAGRIGAQLMAIVAEGDRQRIYLPPDPEHEKAADVPRPDGVPETELSYNPRDLKTPNYGMTHHADLFTNRQLTALCTFSDLVTEASERVIDDGGKPEYADGVATYLAFVVSRTADYSSILCSWNSPGEKMRNTFSRQALPMVWDYAEVNLFSDSTGNVGGALDWVVEVVQHLPASTTCTAIQNDATHISGAGLPQVIISTDPPYYDNIGYADLSDFFYVWLRRSLVPIYPELLSTMLTPKASEMIASPYRHGGDRQKAAQIFEEGFKSTFENLRNLAHPDYPLTVFYAFKQAEGEDGAIASTGWETMLAGLLGTGFAITATWPMRTELANRMLARGTNALASSIVLVCRPRRETAGITDRRGFLAALHAELPKALRELQQGNIAPVDLAQAAIGPGMAVFSRYAKVVEPTGDPMPVRSALALINQVLDEVLAEQEGELDSETRFAIKWFEQYGFDEASYGDAEVLARAMNVSVRALEDAGILAARAGQAHLLRRQDLFTQAQAMANAADRTDTVWGATQCLVRALDVEGEPAAAELLNSVQQAGMAAESCRDLAYRLYAICERRGWVDDALGFNMLVISWPEIARLASAKQANPYTQGMIS